MGKYIVMDIVFKASSLNYDQGSGNYQELKKITRWNGKQHTLVSRYALRYSLLETGKMFNLWEIAPGEKLIKSGSGENTVIQPRVDLLFNGEILLYPEFDLFGYLITSLKPQASKTAPVKISHAISMTPFYYDSQLAGNHGLAKRIPGNMDINLFTIEEHLTYYLYSVVVDADAICRNEVYISAKDDKWSAKIEENGEKYILEISGDKAKKEGIAGKYEISKIKEYKIKDEYGKEIEVVVDTKINTLMDENNKPNVYIISQQLKSKDENNDVCAIRIKKLAKAILNLKREIKAQDKDLSPKLLVLGLYENEPYKTFKDRIALVDEITEESVDEIIETTEGDKKIFKVIHKTVKHSRPVFRIYGVNGSIENLEDSKVLKKIDEFLKLSNNKGVYIYKLPEIEVVMPQNTTGAENKTKQ